MVVSVFDVGSILLEGCGGVSAERDVEWMLREGVTVDQQAAEIWQV